MTKFNALLFKCLPNAAHYGFFKIATSELAEAGEDVKDAVGRLETELNKWFAMETDNMQWYRKSAWTSAIVAANHRLDRALAGLTAQISAARHSAQPNVSAAGERLHIMLKSYGRVAAKPYREEIGDVDAILAHLNGELAADTQTAGVAIWIPEITAGRTELSDLIKERQIESLEKPQSGFPETRRGIESVWHQIVKKVNAGSELNFSPEFDRFINALNPEIDSLNNEYHRTKLDIAHSEPAPIRQQSYTGYPCTPVPEVLYVTKEGTVKLALGKDYNVAYKNNVNVGNAECTIRGKGAYCGRKTVTFIIAR